MCVCPSVRLSCHSAIQRRAAGLPLSAVRAGDIDRQWWAPGAEQQRRRSTALSSECGKCHVDSRVDETEHRLVTIMTITTLIWSNFLRFLQKKSQ